MINLNKKRKDHEKKIENLQLEMNENQEYYEFQINKVNRKNEEIQLNIQA